MQRLRDHVRVCDDASCVRGHGDAVRKIRTQLHDHGETVHRCFFDAPLWRTHRKLESGAWPQRDHARRQAESQSISLRPQATDQLVRDRLRGTSAEDCRQIVTRRRALLLPGGGLCFASLIVTASS